MSELQDEILKILREHENGLSVEEVQSDLQLRSHLNMPQWLISFELDSLRVKGLTTKVGSVWCLRK
jgi:repressor of nif and glnA expression